MDTTPPNNDIFARAVKILAVKANLDTIAPTARLSEDLHFDSLDYTDAAMVAEEEFAVEFHDELMREVKTAADFAAKIEELLRQDK